jgi:putative membrane protein
VDIAVLPHLNAALNATTLVLVSAGFYFVRRKNIAAHRACMLSALGVAVLFLTSYVIYHYNAGSTRFTGTGLIRRVYFFILITHLVLAAAVLPLAVVTARRGLKGRIDAHKKIARWTLPIWIYVSVTGLLVYAFLYHAYPPVK